MRIEILTDSSDAAELAELLLASPVKRPEWADCSVGISGDDTLRGVWRDVDSEESIYRLIRLASRIDGVVEIRLSRMGEIMDQDEEIQLEHDHPLVRVRD
jgi:hypothetical protein